MLAGRARLLSPTADLAHKPVSLSQKFLLRSHRRPCRRLKRNQVGAKEGENLAVRDRYSHFVHENAGHFINHLGIEPFADDPDHGAMVVQHRTAAVAAVAPATARRYGILASDTSATRQ